MGCKKTFVAGQFLILCLFGHLTSCGGIYSGSSSAEESLGHAFRNLTNHQIGLSKLEILLSGQNTNPAKPSIEIAKDLAQRFKGKVDGIVRVLRRNQKQIQDILDKEEVSEIAAAAAEGTTEFLSCCSLKRSLLVYDTKLGTNVNHAFPCQIWGSTDPGNGQDNPGWAGAFRNITEVFKRTHSEERDWKWQYYLSSSGSNLEYPAARIGNTNGACGLKGDSRHQNVFLNVNHPGPKFVLILFDRGSSLSSQQLDLGRAIVQYVISTLDEFDLLGFIALSEDVYFPLGPDCLVPTLVPASLQAQVQLLKFINVVQASSTRTNHSLGFQTAEELIRNTQQVTDQSTINILYISDSHFGEDDGGTSSKRKIFDSIARMQRRQPQNIVINSYSLVEDRHILEDQSITYMKDVAEQNFPAYEIPALSKKQVLKGQYKVVNSTHNMRLSIGDFLQPREEVPNESKRSDISLGKNSYKDVTISAPSRDSVGHGMTVSFGVGLNNGAVIGTDVQLENYLEDFVYFDKSLGGGIYPMLVESRDSGGGLDIVYHPSVFSPTNSPRNRVKFDQVEQVRSGEELHEKILSMKVGSMSEYKLKKSKSENETISNQEKKLMAEEEETAVKYSWSWVESTQYIVILVSQEKPGKMGKGDEDLHGQTQHFNASALGQRDAVAPFNHRLDLMYNGGGGNRANLCRHFQALATLQAGSIFLSPTAFKSPYHHIHEEQELTMRSYMAYLSDSTRLISNPGLQPGIRSEVSAISRITATWKNASLESDFAIRRYLATQSGIYFSYPGSTLSPDFKPHKQKWYKKALEFPERSVLTMSLDSGGAGHIVTVSQALIRRPSSSSRKPEPYADDNVLAVGAVDITVGYLHQIIMDANPLCNRNDGLICFVFDDEGFLVFHPDMMDPTYAGPIEDQHLNLKEPALGNDLMNHQHFVQKRLCHSYPDHTTRRFYHYNTDLNQTLANFQMNDCYHYSVISIPGTNSFLAVVNATCPPPSVFCPCNIRTRDCIICPQVIDDRSCECPCECEIDTATCLTDKSRRHNRHDLAKIPACESHGPERFSLVSSASFLGLAQLPQCYEDKCSQILGRDSCLSTRGCSWCEVEIEVDPELSMPSFAPLSHPHCAVQEQCFGGAVGSSSPYAIHNRGKMLRERADLDRSSASSVGSIAGGVIVFFVFMAFAAFCYKTKLCGGGRGIGERLLGDQSRQQDGMMQMSSIEVLNDNEDEMRQLGAHQNVIAMEMNPIPSAVISPYKMNPRYLRPPPGTDSDHGYSTMTPMGPGTDMDSEVIVPYVQSQAARERLRHRPPASTHPSVTSGVSSRASSPAPSQILVMSTHPNANGSMPKKFPPLPQHHQMFHQQYPPERIPKRNAEDLDNPTTGDDGEDRETEDPEPLEDEHMTILSPNQILVSATVHNVDTQ